MAETDAERTEEATSQRREDFRKRGQVAQTKELSSVLLLFGFAMCAWMFGKFFIQQIMDSYRLVYDFTLPTQLTGENMSALFFQMGTKAILVLIPIFVLALIVAIGSSMLQVGVLFSEEAMSPNLNKINPLEGLKRVLNWKSIVEGLKSMLKIGAIGGVIYYVLRNATDSLPKLGYYNPIQLLNYVSAHVFNLMIWVGVLLLLIAAADYFFQRYNLEEQMKMTKQEVRDEAKTREGDPLIKARIRKQQKEIAQNRMMADVQKADVIVTNPTHLACALKYDPNKYAAPILLAKGQDFVAQRIREIAKEHRIPIIENKPLARTIYKTMEVGQVIPRELFSAVAEVLAYVLKLRKKKMMR
jgi:flagellar biosynthesis protein FlhB